MPNEPVAYNDLIFGRFSITEVLDAVDDQHWQMFRISLLGRPTEEKLTALRCWIHPSLDLSPADRKRHEIQVTNYIYALKRGGLLK